MGITMFCHGFLTFQTPGISMSLQNDTTVFVVPHLESSVGNSTSDAREIQHMMMMTCNLSSEPHKFQEIPSMGAPSMVRRASCKVVLSNSICVVDPGW